MGKIDRSVVRNGAYRKSEFSIRERHNERKNETYYNADIQPDRQNLNVYFKRCGGGYADTFDAMLADGTVSVKGLKKDGSAKVFDELVFDVNTEYFDRNGGYEYAKSFFEEAYRSAVKEIGGEQFVLSAVMHADERNKALSEETGRDVYHYHLHVVYIPVVQKEVYFQKSNKNPELAGKLKEVITQVSHCKKWPRFKENGHWINSYSLLQDRFHEHMKNAGFIGFERGERGSTAEHLSVLEYKTQKEAERAASMTAVVERKQEAAAVLDAAIIEKTEKSTFLDKTVEKKQERIKELNEKITVKKQTAITFLDIDDMAKKTFLGKMELSKNDWETVSGMAKEAITSRVEIKDLKDEVKTAKAAFQKQKDAYMRLVEQVQPYIDAMKLFPQQVKRALESIIQMGRKKQEQKPPKQERQQEYTPPKRKRGAELEI